MINKLFIPQALVMSFLAAIAFMVAVPLVQADEEPSLFVATENLVPSERLLLYVDMRDVDHAEEVEKIIVSSSKWPTPIVLNRGDDSFDDDISKIYVDKIDTDVLVDEGDVNLYVGLWGTDGNVLCTEEGNEVSHYIWGGKDAESDCPDNETSDLNMGANDDDYNAISLHLTRITGTPVVTPADESEITINPFDGSADNDSFKLVIDTSAFEDNLIQNIEITNNLSGFNNPFTINRFGTTDDDYKTSYDASSEEWTLDFFGPELLEDIADMEEDLEFEIALISGNSICTNEDHGSGTSYIWGGDAVGCDTESVSEVDNTFTYTVTLKDIAELSVNTIPATDIARDAVILNGSATGEAPTDRYFEYGLGDNYGTEVHAIACEGECEEGEYHADIINLQCATIYHFRAVADFADTTIYGDDETFTTSDCLGVNTNPASNITKNSVTLNGSATGEAPTDRYFEYGLDDTYDALADDISCGDECEEGAYHVDIVGLECATTYHFRAVAKFGDVTEEGDDATFTTASCPSNNNGGGSSSHVVSGGYRPAVVNNNTPVIENPTTVPASYTFTRELEEGVSGDDVTKLQQFLADRGLLNVAPTGYFGPATKSALQAYQTSKGISATGYFGPLTMSAVNSEYNTTVTTPENVDIEALRALLEEAIKRLMQLIAEQSN